MKQKIGFYHVVLTTPKTSPGKITLTIVEMQQLPEIGNVDSNNELSCLERTIYNGRRKVFISFKTNMDKLNIVADRCRNNKYVKVSKMELKLIEFEKLPSQRVDKIRDIDVFSSSAFYWMKQLFLFVVNFIKKGCCPSSEYFPTLPESKC